MNGPTFGGLSSVSTNFSNAAPIAGASDSSKGGSSGKGSGSVLSSGCRKPKRVLTSRSDTATAVDAVDSWPDGEGVQPTSATTALLTALSTGPTIPPKSPLTASPIVVANAWV